MVGNSGTCGHTPYGGPRVPVCPTTLTEVERTKEKMFRRRSRNLYKSINLGLAFSITTFFGCATTSPESWHPKTRQEMVDLIGQTTLEALAQFAHHMRQQRRSQPMPPNESLKLYMEDKNKG
jgi:hypothetical protein